MIGWWLWPAVIVGASIFGASAMSLAAWRIRPGAFGRAWERMARRWARIGDSERAFRAMTRGLGLDEEQKSALRAIAAAIGCEASAVCLSRSAFERGAARATLGPGVADGLRRALHTPGV